MNKVQVALSAEPVKEERGLPKAAPHRIDVHHHVMPSWYVDAVIKAGAPDAGGVAFPQWDVKSTLAMMDRRGIATAVTSFAAPGVYFGDLKAARELARRCNEYSAELVRETPDRFGAFAVLPLPDVDAALEEIKYGLDTLRLDGVILLTNISGTHLGDPSFDAVFDELNRRKAVVFVHPEVDPTSLALDMRLPGALVEFTFDTTRAATNLIFSGTMERCPDLKIILSHAGGALPYLAHRLTIGTLVPALRERAPLGPIAYVKRFYYDTAISGSAPQMSTLRELVDPSHIVFGSDWPFLPEPRIETEIQGLRDYDGFTQETRAAVERDNSLALFPRLQNR